MSERIRVLVVDDSALMRKLIPAILARDSSIEVVGTAMDGAFALRKIEELEPDVVTLDLEMRSEEHSLNSSHTVNSYAVFCLKKKNKKEILDHIIHIHAAICPSISMRA